MRYAVPRKTPSPLAAEYGRKAWRYDKSQKILAVALFLVAVGNIAIPNSIPVISSFYLITALLAVFLVLLYKLQVVFFQLRFSLLIIATFVSFIPGFLATSLNDYGLSKLAGVAISALLVLGPFAFVDPDRSIIFLTRCLLVLSLTTSVLILLVGENSASGRLTLLGLNPIGTARITGVATIILTLLLVSGRANSPYKKLFLLIGTIISLVATIETGSRGPTLSILVSLIVIFLLSWKVTGAKPYPALSVLFTGLATAAYFLSSNEKGTRILSSDSSGRDVLFELAIDSIKSNPIGIGWGNYGYLISGTLPQSGVRVYPHNIFLEIGVEGGWIAFCGFFAIVVAGVVNLLRFIWRGSQTALILIALLVFFLVNASLSSDFVGNRAMWLLLGLSLLRFRFGKEIRSDENI